MIRMQTCRSCHEVAVGSEIDDMIRTDYRTWMHRTCISEAYLDRLMRQIRRLQAANCPRRAARLLDRYKKAFDAFEAERISSLKCDSCGGRLGRFASCQPGGDLVNIEILHEGRWYGPFGGAR